MSTDVFLKFEYDARDIVYATLLRKRGKLPGRAVLLLGALATVAVAVLLVRVCPAWLRTLGVWLVVIGAVHWGFTALRVVPHAMFRKGTDDAAWLRQVRTDFWNRKMSVDASEDGIAVTIGRRSAMIKWRECRGFESDARAYLVHHGDAGYLVVPRRAFRNERKDAAFRELAERRAHECEEHGKDLSAPTAQVVAEPPGAAASEALAPSPDAERPLVTAAASPKVGRNDPCPCGSGRKYKKCCLGVLASERGR